MSVNQDGSSLKGWMSEYYSLLDAGFSFAYQPIVDGRSGKTRGLEAFLRGVSGESARSIIDKVRPENQFAFDQACRIRAIEMGVGLAGTADIHLNCGSVTAQDIDLVTETTIHAADRFGFSPERIVLEFGDLPRMGNARALASIGQRVRDAGIRVLADSFGATDAGLKRLVVFQPHAVKLDRTLVSGVHKSRRRQAIVKGLAATCQALEIQVIAGGVETAAELEWLREAGLNWFQGFYFARPAYEQAPRVRGATTPVVETPPRPVFESRFAWA